MAFLAVLLMKRRRHLFNLGILLILLSMSEVLTDEIAPSPEDVKASNSDEQQSAAAGSTCVSTDAVSMQLRWLRNGQFAGYYAAQALGYYQEECLDVTLLQRRASTTAEQTVLNGDAEFGIPWAMSDIALREKNASSYKTIAQIFRRPGNVVMASHLHVPNNITSLADISKAAQAMGRPVRMGATDAIYSIWARLSQLGVKTCGVYRSSSAGGDPTCGPDDELEIFQRELSGVKNIKVGIDDPAFADIRSGHVTDLSDILRAEAADGDIVGSTDRVKLINSGGVNLLEDGVCVSEAWLSSPGNIDIARRFLKATMRGWIYCRDSPRACAEAAVPTGGKDQRDFLFQVIEVNKLIWPSAQGVGWIDVEEFQDMYDYVAATGLSSRVYNASNGLVTDIMAGVVKELEDEGYDVYGHLYSSESKQQTLSYCPDDNGTPILCALRCAPGSEPPAGGDIFYEDDCLVCNQGFASPGGSEPCLACKDGHVAPSAGMSQCVADKAKTTGLIAGVSVTGAVIALMAVLGILMWRRSVRLRDQLAAIHASEGLNQWDMNSPIVEALTFLDDVAKGRHRHTWRPWLQAPLEHRAAELRAKLLRAADVRVPDVEEIMTKTNKFSADIVDFVMQSAGENTRATSGRGNRERQDIKDIILRQTYSEESRSGGKNALVMPSDFAEIGHSFTGNVLAWIKVRPSGLLAEVLVRFVKQWNLNGKLSLSTAELRTFALNIEDGHQSNPYHNLAHSIDVTVRLGTILNKSGLADYLANYSGNDGCITLLAAIISAVVHDYQHFGLSNHCVVEEGLEVAIKFNDQSCLENQALLAALELVRDKETSFCAHFSRAQHKKLRGLIIKMVLATDMGKHFAVMTAVQTRVLDQHCSSDGRKSVSFSDFNDEQMHNLMQLILKAADLGHCGLPINQHLQWVHGLEQEMWAQGDLEKARGLPISPLADRTKPGVLWGSNQVGFFQALACPLYAMLTTVAPGCRELQEAVNNNLDFWRQHPEAPPVEMMKKLTPTNRASHDSASSRVSPLPSKASPQDDEVEFLLPSGIKPGQSRASLPILAESTE